MNNRARDDMDHRFRPWDQPSRDEMAREIQELVLGPYWQQLHPSLRRHWLDRLGELQRRD